MAKGARYWGHEDKDFHAPDRVADPVAVRLCPAAPRAEQTVYGPTRVPLRHTGGNALAGHRVSEYGTDHLCGRGRRGAPEPRGRGPRPMGRGVHRGRAGRVAPQHPPPVPHSPCPTLRHSPPHLPQPAGDRREGQCRRTAARAKDGLYLLRLRPHLRCRAVQQLPPVRDGGHQPHVQSQQQQRQRSHPAQAVRRGTGGRRGL